MGKCIDWRDRKVITQRSESFAEWLRSKLTPASDTERSRIESRLLRSEYNSDYSTHPNLNYRLS